MVPNLKCNKTYRKFLFQYVKIIYIKLFQFQFYKYLKFLWNLVLADKWYSSGKE